MPKLKEGLCISESIMGASVKKSERHWKSYLELQYPKLAGLSAE